MVELPREVSRGTVTLFGIQIDVIQLDDGRRIIDAEGFERLLRTMANEGLDMKNITTTRAKLDDRLPLSQGRSEVIDPIESAIVSEHSRQQWELEDWQQFSLFLSGMADDDREELRQSVAKRNSQWVRFLCPICDYPHPAHATNCALTQK